MGPPGLFVLFVLQSAVAAADRTVLAAAVAGLACSTVAVHICTQCNMYVPRYPATRTALPVAAVAGCCPNFYTENMCRKATVSHKKRYRVEDRERDANDLDAPTQQRLWHAFLQWSHAAPPLR